MGIFFDLDQMERDKQAVKMRGLLGDSVTSEMSGTSYEFDQNGQPINISQQSPQVYDRQGSGFLGSNRGAVAQQNFMTGAMQAGYSPQQTMSLLEPMKQEAENKRQGMLGQIEITKAMSEASLKQGNVLRKERGEELQPFVEAKTQYNTTMNSLKQGNSAGALAAIFSFMKTLDPRSVVREGEFDMAASTGGVMDSLVGMVNKAQGEGMGAVARKNIAETIQAIMEGRVADAEAIAQNYDKIAQEQGVPTSQIRTGAYNPELQGVPDSFTIPEKDGVYEYRTDPNTGKQQRRKK